MLRFQFRTSTALIVTFWVAVYFAAAVLENRYDQRGVQSLSDRLLSTLFFFFFTISPAAAVGAACKHPVVGLLCGLASFLAIALGDTFVF